MTEFVFSPIDHAHMASALRLAERGLYSTQPNPRVGCVIARDDEVLGRGWHRRAGGPHAEVFALDEAGDRARGATAYVSLEPCSHHGRTPPCADALVAAGITRVVVALEDPFAQVDGRGIARLRDAGIMVETGLMQAHARELNRGFLSRVERGRPWVRIKLAMSLDGRTALANGQSNWISSEASRADVQRWRARSSAILTGSGTVLADDPRLTVRDSPSEDSVAPMRVVLDQRLRTPASAHLLDGSVQTLVFHGPEARPDDARFNRVDRAILELNGHRLELSGMLRELARRDINELQVEAGPTLCGAFFAQGLVDEVLLYVAPVMLGDAARPLLALPALEEISGRHQMKVIDQRSVGPDWRLLLRPGET